MPGNVHTASPTSVYPFTRFSSYSVTRTCEAAVSEYPDGSSQRRAKASSSKRRFAVAHRLTGAELESFRTFWKAHLRSPFIFTDLSTGLQLTAIFGPSWKEEWSVGRYTAAVEVIEIG